MKNFGLLLHATLGMAAALLVSACRKSSIPPPPGDPERYQRVLYDARGPHSPVTEQELLENLRSPDRDLVRESLGALVDRHASADQDYVVTLLADPEPLVWLNAAHYLGINHRQESVPYLIKTLHFWGANLVRPRAVALLQEMTGQSFPDDFGKWRNWYDAQHPATPMDWESNLNEHL